jgi:hypothetical protein
MIAFACSITEPEPFRRYAEPGIRLAAEPDSEVYAFAAVGSISRSYNLLLDAAAVRDDLEALVIVHPHTEIVDPRMCDKIRAAFADEQVAVLGSAGATGVHSIAWWEGSVTSASVIHRYGEFGGGEMPAFSWTHPDPPPREVETVDGFLLVLSPWAVRNIRFDESLLVGHGYELDLCLQVRSAGRKVMVADLRTMQHRSLDPFEEPYLWVVAHMEVAEKWDSRVAKDADPDGEAWKELARRAEAEREAARAIAHSNVLASDARLLELERALHAMIESRSWRVTSPLRWANRRRRAAAARREQQVAP